MAHRQQEAAERIQTVVFLRHGIAKHNLRVHGKPPDHNDPSMLDPPLVYEGQMGAIQAGHCIQSRMAEDASCPSRFQLHVCSPLTRCIQTTVLAFLPGENYCHQNPPESTPPTPIVCKEDVREAFGIYLPDQRRKKSVLVHHWPQVQFETDMTEDDDAWKPDWRERYVDVETRVDRFLAWLVQRPEECIAVVSHGVWMEALFQKYDPLVLGGSSGQQQQQRGHGAGNGQQPQHGHQHHHRHHQPTKRVHNCDAFLCRIVSKNGVFERIQGTQHISGRTDYSA